MVKGDSKRYDRSFLPGLNTNELKRLERLSQKYLQANAFRISSLEAFFARIRSGKFYRINIRIQHFI